MQTTQQKTYLIFWNVEGVPDTIEDLVKVKSDMSISLGNLICDSHYGEDDIRNSIYSLSLAKYYDCHILKGENERECTERSFPHRRMQEELKQLPITLESNGLIFLPSLPVPYSKDDENLIKERLRKLSKPISHLKDQELSEVYGTMISKNLDYLQYRYPKTEVFFYGGRECAAWQRFGSRAHPKGIYEFLGELEGSKELTLNSLPCIVSPGEASSGYYCTLTMPEKKLTFYSV